MSPHMVPMSRDERAKPLDIVTESIDGATMSVDGEAM